MDVASGAATRIVEGEVAVTEFDLASDGTLYAEVSKPQTRPEVYRVGEEGLQAITAVNTELMAGIELGNVEKHSYTAADGTALETFVVFPPDYKDGRDYPAILLSHGGPWAQWDWGFNFEAQLFAANGYVVVMPNVRGSGGRGQEFALALNMATGYTEVLRRKWDREKKKLKVDAVTWGFVRRRLEREREFRSIVVEFDNRGAGFQTNGSIDLAVEPDGDVGVADGPDVALVDAIQSQ